MQCVTPMLRIANKNDLSEVKIIGSKALQQIMESNQNYLSSTGLHDFSEWFSDDWQRTIIPCGKCYACRLTYSAEWATRIMLEKEYYPEHECWFITLTYNDDHVKIPNEFTYVKPDPEYIKQYGRPYKDLAPMIETTYRNDGTWTGTLDKAEIQRFIKRVRKHFPNKEIKYFLCGEYGGAGTEGATLRPHYHMILLGCPFEPKEFYDHHIDRRFFKMHNKSHELDQLWHNKGFADMAQVEWSNCSYVARYCMKKVGDSWSEEEWAKLGKIPEFVLMSRNIGMQYYDDHKEEIWKNDNIIMKTVKDNIGSCKPPKAFMRRCEKEDPETAARIKKERYDLSIKKLISGEYEEGYNDLEKLIIEADKIATKAKMLKREL